MADAVEMDGDDSMPLQTSSSVRVPAKTIPRGRDGRFAFTAASSSGSSKHSRSDGEDDWIVKTPVPRGPSDGLVSPSFLEHIAHTIWSGQDRGLLRCQTRSLYCGKLCVWYGGASKKIQTRIESSELFHLPSIMYGHIDAPLIAAFVERW